MDAPVFKTRNQKYYALHREKMIEASKAYRLKNLAQVKDRIKDCNRKRLYGLSTQKFEELVERQAGLCSMCCNPMKPGRGTHIDHCHETSSVRGLLCTKCNMHLGVLENVQFVTDAHAYLTAVQNGL